MGVLDGQDVSAGITNPAFINKNIDDVMPNKLGFNRLGSGASLADVQAAVNKLYTASGASESQTGTVYDATPSTINNGDPYQTALTKLAGKFDPATGHFHTGAAGDGPLLSASSIGSVPSLGYIEQGTTFSAGTGTADNVSSLMVGKLSSSGPSVLGVCTTSPQNKCRLLLATGPTSYRDILDTSGNLVYGRITATAPTGGVWTLSYFSEQAALETPYMFPATGGTPIFWWYQELFNPLLTSSNYNPSMHLFSPGSTGTSSGGGGGGTLEWVEFVNSPTPLYENNVEVYGYDNGLAQQLYASIKVPSTYVVGSPISLQSFFYSDDTTGNVLFRTVCTLIRTGTDTISSTTNQRTSTNAAVTLTGGTVDIPQALTFDLSSTGGTINGTAVHAGDLLIVQFFRDTDTSVVQAKAMMFASEVTFT